MHMLEYDSKRANVAEGEEQMILIEGRGGRAMA